MLVRVPELVTAYYTMKPDPAVPEQRVVFGTSGHRGCAFDKAFNENHILAINQAICRYRAQKMIDGPLSLGMDTHALSVPAYAGALEVLAVEIMARMGRDRGDIYQKLTQEFGEPQYERVEAPATLEQKELLAKLSPRQIKRSELAGEKIQTILTEAPGNGAPIGGWKVITENGWFAARPSGTEDIYKIYVESFHETGHLSHILEEAQTIVGEVLASSLPQLETLPASEPKENRSRASTIQESYDTLCASFLIKVPV